MGCTSSHHRNINAKPSTNHETQSEIVEGINIPSKFGSFCSIGADF